MPHRLDAVVLGAGAAGLYCALEAGQRGARVLLLDHSPQPGRKILISGGGRCNFTNLNTHAENFLSENPHFARSALAAYTPLNFLNLVERHGIAWHEKTAGQLFCDGSARQILDMLLAGCANAGVRLETGVQVTGVEHGPHGFTVRTALANYTTPALVVATGGLSIAKVGATGFGYDVARQFGLRVVEPRPALVPLLFESPGCGGPGFHGLAGVAAEVAATAGGARFRDKLLITHRGFSGPAILQVSSYWRPGGRLTIDFAPDHPAGENLLEPLLASPARRSSSSMEAVLRTVLPQRLAARLAEIGAPARWTNHELAAAGHRLRRWILSPAGTEGFEKAEVTAGGVDTAALDAKTMQARSVPGVYFIGEVVDVTGQLGGYNFQWAWASAAAAARALVP